MYSNLLAQRAGAAERKGESDQEFECIKRIMEAKPLNDLAYAAVAWFYASSPEARYRNGKKAVEYAEKAVSLKRHYAHLDTLAAAYAEAGDFAKAVSIQEEAIRLCDSQLKGDFGERLALYQSQRPYYRKPR